MLSSHATSEVLGCLNISYKTAHTNVNHLRSNSSNECQESHWKSPSPEQLEPQLEKHVEQLCASRHQELQRHAICQTASPRSCHAACLKFQRLTRQRCRAVTSLQHHCRMNHNVCDEVEQQQIWCEYESTACLKAAVYHTASEVVSANYEPEKSVQSLPDVKYNSGPVVSQQMDILHDPAFQIISNPKAVNKTILPTIQQPLKSVSHPPANVVLGHNMPEEKSHPLLDIKYSDALASQLPDDSSLLHDPALQALSGEISVNKPLFPTAQQPLEAVIYSPAEVISDHRMPEEKAQPTADVQYKLDPAVSQHTDSSILHDHAHQGFSDKIKVNKQLFPIVQKSLEPVFYPPAEGVLHDPALQVISSKEAINKQLFPTTQPPLKLLSSEDAANDIPAANRRNPYADIKHSQAPYSVSESKEKSGERDSSLNESIKSRVEVRADVSVKASVQLQSVQSVTNSEEARGKTMVAKDRPVCTSLTVVSHKTKKTLISDASKRTANMMRSDDILPSENILTELEFENSEMNPSPKPLTKPPEENLSQVQDPKSRLTEMEQSSKVIQPPAVDSSMPFAAFDRSLRSSRMVDSLQLSQSQRDSLLCEDVETQYVSTPTFDWGMRSSKIVDPTRLTQSTKDSVLRGSSSQDHHVPIKTFVSGMRVSKTQDSLQSTQSQKDSILRDSVLSDIMKSFGEIQTPQSRRVTCREFGSCIKTANPHQQLFITLITPEIEEMFGYYSSIVDTIARKSNCRVRLLRAVLNRRTSGSGTWARFAQIEISGRQPESVMACDRMLREKFHCYENRRRVNTENRKPMNSMTTVRSTSDTSLLAFGMQRYNSRMSSRIRWSFARLQLMEPEEAEMAIKALDFGLLGDNQVISADYQAPSREKTL